MGEAKAQCCKTFYVRNFPNKSERERVPGKPFQPRPMFVSKAGAYPIKKPFRCFSLDRLQALPTNIRPGWKALPETNILAYYENL